MSDLDHKIEELAESLEKATKSPEDKLFNTIKELGKDGIRKKLLAKSEDGTPLLNQEDREVLKSALEKMKKAVEMDDQYQAKYIQGNINDTKLQEDKADDDQDEKLVKPEAASHNHQGTPTDGWEGQVIKAKELDEKKEKKAKKKMADAMDDIAESEADEAVKEHNKKLHPEAPKSMKKSEVLEKKQGVPEGVDPEKHERCVKEVKKQGKGTNPYAVCNASMKKSKEELLEMKKSVEEDLKSSGVEPTVELVKAKMKEKLLKEEDQLSDTDEATEGKDRGDKSRPDALKLEEDNKSAQKKVNDMNQGSMKKSLEWDGPNALIKAGRGGQNMHFNVNTYYDNALKTMENSKEESLEKSEKESKEFDVNDYIEKGFDMNRHDVLSAQEIVSQKKGEFVKKSFEDNEIAQALGLTEEEAKKILGE